MAKKKKNQKYKLSNEIYIYASSIIFVLTLLYVVIKKMMVGYIMGYIGYGCIYFLSLVVRGKIKEVEL